MNPNRNVQDFLKRELARRLRSNPQYSQSAFARDLGLSSGELSETLRGKRKLSLRSAYKICDKLELRGFERDRLLELAGGAPKAERETTVPASLDFFEVLLDPIALMIFTLADTERFDWSVTSIATRLGLKPTEIEVALQNLERIQLIQKTARGYQRHVKSLSSPEDVPSATVRALHHYFLTRAKMALDMQPLSQRQFDGLTFAASLSDIPEIKKDIADFSEHLDAKYSRNRKKKDTLYHFEAALFRLDNEGKKS